MDEHPGPVQKIDLTDFQKILQYYASNNSISHEKHPGVELTEFKVFPREAKSTMCTERVTDDRDSRQGTYFRYYVTTDCQHYTPRDKVQRILKKTTAAKIDKKKRQTRRRNGTSNEQELNTRKVMFFPGAQTSIEPEGEGLLVGVLICLNKVVKQAPPVPQIDIDIPSKLPEPNTGLTGQSHHQILCREPTDPHEPCNPNQEPQEDQGQDLTHVERTSRTPPTAVKKPALYPFH